MPRNDESDNLHRHFTYQLLAKSLVWELMPSFTSEAYGDGFAQFLSDPRFWFSGWSMFVST